MMSLRTSPQTGVAIPPKEGKTHNYRQKCREIQGIPTPVCALARNDMVYRHAETTALPWSQTVEKVVLAAKPLPSPGGGAPRSELIPT